MIEIKLTQGQVAIIDAADFDLVSLHKWHSKWDISTKSFYASTHIRLPDGRETTILMHRLIVNAKKGELVDHKNHCTLDNRRFNLRVCTRSENCRNSIKPSTNKSGFKGVFWEKCAGKWRARIMSEGKKIHLGLFESPSEAHLAYCEAAKKLHGEFANFG